MDRLVASGGTRPDALLISGGLTAAGGIREFDEVLTFLARLRGILDLDPHRIADVPGPCDVNHAACRAYFASCEADEVAPQPPYWDKWRHYFRFFRELYDGVGPAGASLIRLASGANGAPGVVESPRPVVVESMPAPGAA